MRSDERERDGWQRHKLLVVVACTLVAAALVIGHVRGVNGPWYWYWTWRRLSPVALYPAMLLAAAPVLAAQFLFARLGKWSLLLIAVSTLAMQWVAISLQPRLPDEPRVFTAIKDRYVTSYYIDALKFHRQNAFTTRRFLSEYPEVLPALNLHSKYKPPGLLLFYVGLINIFGEQGAVAAAAVVISVLAAAAGPATYLFQRALGIEPEASFAGASYMALAPSLILFFPQFDQTYPAIACGLLATWAVALRGRWWWAAAFAAMLALALFLSYIFLVLGAFLGLYTIFQLRGNVSRVVVNIVIVLFTVPALFGLLYVVTGFNPIATFRAIRTYQSLDQQYLARPFPLHILFDLLDFALGLGWLVIPLTVFSFVHAVRRRLKLICILQVAAVALLALLPGESARLWLPLMPVVMVPVGMELARWSPRERAVALLCLAFLTTVICQNMVFNYIMRGLDEPAATQALLSLVTAAVGE